MPLILASTSPYRRQLLERLGLPFTQVAPDCDEEAIKASCHDPQAIAEQLAYCKAASIAARDRQATVIGSDQLATIDELILGKPGDREGAIAQLSRLAGRSHRLITACCVIHAGEQHLHTDITTLHMRRLDAAAIARYLDRDRPFDCAGAYKLESAGITLFERIESADHSAITGLPLIALTAILSRCGHSVP